MNIFQFVKLIISYYESPPTKSLLNVKLYLVNIIHLNYTLQMNYIIVTVSTKLRGIGLKLNCTS